MGRSACSEQEPERDEERRDHEDPTDQDEGARPQARSRSRRWRSAATGLLPRLRASGRADPDQRPAGCRGRRPGQRRAPHRRSRGGDEPTAVARPPRARRRSSSRRSRRAGSSRSRPQLRGVGPTRAAPLPSITRSLRCSLIADPRRYATEPRAAARRGAISAAGRACRRAPERPAPSPRPASSRSAPSSGSCRRPAGACSGTETAACRASGPR